MCETDGDTSEMGSSKKTDGEGERVIQIFDGAPKSDRARLYEAVEGHPWNGDWVEGWFTSDDNIWNALSRSQLKRLPTVINGG